MTEEVVVANAWHPEAAPSGHVYYYNAATGESRWRLPDEDSTVTSCWTEMRAASGHPYYYNVRTGETSWSIPNQ